MPPPASGDLAADLEESCPICGGAGDVSDAAWEDWQSTEAEIRATLASAGGLIEAEICHEALVRHRSARPRGGPSRDTTVIEERDELLTEPSRDARTAFVVVAEDHWDRHRPCRRQL